MTEWSSLIPSITALSVPAVIAVVLTMLRPRLTRDARTMRRLLVAVGLTICAQALHFVEELVTELYLALPTTFGFPAAPRSLFVQINVTALIVWAVALVGVRQGVVIALLPLWFLGFCEVLNLVLHPALALWTGGYYPGVFTAPLVGALGIWTVVELTRATADTEPNAAQRNRMAFRV